MKFITMIKSLFWGIGTTIFVMFIAGIVLSIIASAFSLGETAISAIIVIMGIIAILLCPVSIWAIYNGYKKQSTCPRCKTPFVFYEKEVGTEALSEDYITQDVKDSNGVYRRKSYKVGKERVYYETKCKECGHTTERSAVRDFKREV